MAISPGSVGLRPPHWFQFDSDPGINTYYRAIVCIGVLGALLQAGSTENTAIGQMAGYMGKFIIIGSGVAFGTMKLFGYFISKSANQDVRGTTSRSG